MKMKKRNQYEGENNKANIGCGQLWLAGCWRLMAGSVQPIGGSRNQAMAGWLAGWPWLWPAGLAAQRKLWPQSIGWRKRQVNAMKVMKENSNETAFSNR